MSRQTLVMESSIGLQLAFVPINWLPLFQCFPSVLQICAPWWHCLELFLTSVSPGERFNFALRQPTFRGLNVKSVYIFYFQFYTLGISVSPIFVKTNFARNRSWSTSLGSTMHWFKASGSWPLFKLVPILSFFVETP